MSAGEFKLFSFDVFDTVLTRRVAAPRSLFLLLGKRLRKKKKISCSAKHFYQARILTEEQICGEGAHFYQPTLLEIYQRLQKVLKLTDSTTHDAMLEEIQIEITSVYPVPEMKKRVWAARKKAKVIFVSDMYLPAEVIKEMLRGGGLLREDDHLYVSCEHRASKRTGDLFKKILACENIQPCEMVHCGNDSISDIKAPKSLGIVAEPFMDANLNSCEAFIERFSNKTMGAATLMAGAVRQSRLRMNFKKGCEKISYRGEGWRQGGSFFIYLFWYMRISLKRLW